MLDKPTSFIAACKDFFGFMPGQSLGQFKTEVDQLTQEDRADIKAGLEKIGYQFMPSNPTA